MWEEVRGGWCTSVGGAAGRVEYDAFTLSDAEGERFCKENKEDDALGEWECEGEDDEGGGAAGERDASGNDEDVVGVAAAVAAVVVDGNDGDLEDENEEDNDADAAGAAFDVGAAADNVLDAVGIEGVIDDADDAGDGFVGSGFTGVVFDSTFAPETGESSLLCSESMGGPFV